jgi:hypothetical protein
VSFGAFFACWHWRALSDSDSGSHCGQLVGLIVIDCGSHTSLAIESISTSLIGGTGIVLTVGALRTLQASGNACALLSWIIGSRWTWNWRLNTCLTEVAWLAILSSRTTVWSLGGRSLVTPMTRITVYIVSVVCSPGPIDLVSCWCCTSLSWWAWNLK